MLELQNRLGDLPADRVMRMKSAPHAMADQLLSGGPFIGVQTRIGLMTTDRPRIMFRSVLVICLGWLPLVSMTAVQGAFLHDNSLGLFLSDYGVHARSLIAAPLLVVAEGFTIPRLGAIIRHFGDAGLIVASDKARFQAAIDSTRRLCDSARLEIAALALTIAIAALAFWSVPLGMFPAWHSIGSGAAANISSAGLWHSLVSVPLLLALVLGWFWRLALWTRFLWLTSRLDLNLIPAHPDRAAGLKFVGLSVNAFCPVALPMSAIVAGTVANRVLHDGMPLLAFRYLALSVAAGAIVLLAGPLLVFSMNLLAVWRRGIFEYGALARSLGARMEHKWLRQPVTDEALGAPDFSATTDLYSVAANVYAMKIVPVDLTNLALAAGAALLPFMPVVLFAASPEVVFEKLTKLLL